jgi:hypothetical protein
VLANHRRFLAGALAMAFAMVGLVHLAPAASGDDHLTGNPIVRDIFTADPAALVHDGRMYIYTGRDEASPTQANFVMREWHAFSSTTPTNDPDVWEHHGALLSIDDFAWANANAWASEVVQGPDGRFYWFVSLRRTDAQPGTDVMSIGVAVANTPLGPFEDAIGAPLITSAMPNASAHNIDPTVIVDDEHGIYMYWGSFWSPRFVKLKDNMIELDSPIMTPQGLSEFWEAPWIFERDGVYYNAYASNANISGDGCVTSSSFACIRYATADNPAGPWTHRGIVLGQVSSTTNHPAIVEFPAGSDEWWMVYHTADLPDGGTFRRSVAIDRLFFNPDGTMQQVVQTRFEFPPPPPEPTDNAALSATVTCSYSSPWERCSAVNTGDDPASSNIPAANIGTRWGTWPQGGTHWVEYSWDRPVRIDASDMYWFQDVPDTFNGGVKRPEQWSIEYWDGEGWVEVSNPSEYGLELNQYNRTTFDRVTTTRLRAVLETRTTAGGTGALEWKVYSVEPSSVDAVYVTTPVGVPPELPETVTLRYDDGESLEAGVWWRPFDDDLLDQPGTFTVTGVIENNLVEAEATVVVDTCPDGYSADQNITFSDLDSQVPNRDRGDGCTFLDLVWAQAPFADHGGFVAAVEMVKDDYEAAGLITGREGGTIMMTAAQATDAWREGPPDQG